MCAIYENCNENNVCSFVFCSKLELNVLYVEQEIEEAIAQGRADEYEFSYARLKFGRFNRVSYALHFS